MSFEVFEKLEAKVQQAIDTITLLQMEIEELKDKTTLCRRKFRLPPATTKRWCAKPTAERRTARMARSPARSAGQNGRGLIPHAMQQRKGALGAFS